MTKPAIRKLSAKEQAKRRLALRRKESVVSGSASWLRRAPANASYFSGLGAVAMMMHHRDAVEVRKAGRRTLAIALGPHATGALYATLMLAPFALLGALAPLAGDHVWIALLAAPLAGWLVWRFWRVPIGEKFNAILAQTAQAQAVFALLLCLGLLL